MKTVLSILILAAAALAQEYKAQAGGGPPGELAGPVRNALEGQGIKVTDDRGFTFCEVWFRNAPIGDTSIGEAVSKGSMPSGTLIGAVRFHAPSAGRDGRGFPPGVYTLRFTGGDSVALLPAPSDQDLEPPSDVSGASKATLRFTRSSGQTPRVEMTSSGEWIVHGSVGGTQVALLVTGVTKE